MGFWNFGENYEEHTQRVREMIREKREILFFHNWAKSKITITNEYA
jgi:hypothetical protein